jgi:hypothetical protein
MTNKAWTFPVLVVLVLGVGRGWADEEGAEFAADRAAPVPAPTMAVNDQVAPMPLPHPQPCAEACDNPSCWRRLWEWLTYHPLERPGLCGCRGECPPCGWVRNYLFFLCDRWGPMGDCCAGPGCQH